MGESKPICLRLCSPIYLCVSAQRQSHLFSPSESVGPRQCWKLDAQTHGSEYRTNQQHIRAFQESDAPRIKCKQSTTHKQTIWAKLTAIYAMERYYLWVPGEWLPLEDRLGRHPVHGRRGERAIPAPTGFTVRRGRASIYTCRISST